MNVVLVVPGVSTNSMAAITRTNTTGIAIKAIPCTFYS